MLRLAPANLAKCSWPAVAWQSNNTRPVFIYSVALVRTVWRRVIYPGRVRYATLRAKVAVGLVGHTCTELNYTSFGCDRPHGALAPCHATARHSEGLVFFGSRASPTTPSHLHTLCGFLPKNDMSLPHAEPSFPNPPRKKNQQKFQCGHRIRLCKIK